MPAGINGPDVYYSQTQDQTAMQVSCSTKRPSRPHLNHTANETQAGHLNHSKPANRCIITKNNTQTGGEILGEQEHDQELKSRMCTDHSSSDTLNLITITQPLTCKASKSAQLSWREYLHAAIRIRPSSPHDLGLSGPATDRAVPTNTDD